MTTLSEIFAILAPALTTSQTIAAWCQEKFQRPVNVFVGVDPLELPELKPNCPMIAIVPGRRSRIPEQYNRVHEIRIRTAIHDSRKPVFSNQITTFPGLALADEFANLVEEQITITLTDNHIATTQDPEDGDEVIPPYFISRWAHIAQCPT